MKRLKFALLLTTRIVRALLFVCVLVRQAHADADFFHPAFLPGKELTRFLASSEYSTCENISPPTITGDVDRLEFDSHDNLWMSGTNMGLVKELSSERYTRFESFGFYQASGFTFDPAGNMWIAEPRSPSEMVHIPNLTELIGSASYTNRFETEVPGITPVDIAAGANGDLWMPGDWMPGSWRQAYQVLKLAKGRSYSNPIRFTTDQRIRRMVVSRTGAMFAIVNSPGGSGLQVVEMKLEGSALREIRTIADMHWEASITLDGKGNLWALQQSWIGGPNQVVELLGSSGYSKQKSFSIPRRVFGIAADRAGNVWVTSPYKNVPYAVQWQHPSGFRPEDITEIDAASDHSKQTAFVASGWPYGVAADSAGNIWIANGKENPGNIIELLASSGHVQQRTFSVPGQSYGIAADKSDNIWVSGALRGSNVSELSRAANYAVAREIQVPRRASAIAFDPEGNLWIADSEGYDYEITECLASSDYKDLQRFTVKGHPFGLAFDKSGNLWVATVGCPRNRIVELLKAANYANEVSFPIDGRPYGVTVDARGNVWAAVASQPSCEITEFAASAGYAPSRKLELPAGYHAIGVDSQENLWLQAYGYVEMDGFSSVPGSGRRYP